VLNNNGQIFSEQENWIFESITETYIPLFEALSGLSSFSLNGNEVILSFTPCTIQQMLEGKDRYLMYLKLLKTIAEAEIERTSSIEKFNKYQKNKMNLSDEELDNINKTARFYFDRVMKSIKFYESDNILSGIKNIKNIKLWTSSINHNYLPIYNEKTAEYFIKRGIEEFEKNFDRPPDGFWLPECAFYPGLEKILIRNGIKSTSLNITGLGLYKGNEKSGIYEYDDLMLYLHDFRICKYLWKGPVKTIASHKHYREFYRDLGFDVVPEYLMKLGLTIPDNRKDHGVWTGFKYYSISDPETKLGDKWIYNIDAARSQIKNDVNKFYNILEEHRELVNDYKTFVLAFDTEFFGHWWFEGIWWLKEVFQNGN
jgi:1,4-alpha-glucan branching enzyme